MRPNVNQFSTPVKIFYCQFHSEHRIHLLSPPLGRTHWPHSFLPAVENIRVPFSVFQRSFLISIMAHIMLLLHNAERS